MAPPPTTRRMFEKNTNLLLLLLFSPSSFAMKSLISSPLSSTLLPPLPPPPPLFNDSALNSLGSHSGSNQIASYSSSSPPYDHLGPSGLLSSSQSQSFLPFNWTFDPMNDYVTISENIFLIVSNFFLLPAIYLALKCRYRGEAIIYSITMLSSSFYHLCDNRKIKYCVLPYHTLQFLDFYSAILTLWVTAILIAPVQQRWISSFQLTGSVFFAALLQSTSVVGFWSFVVPGFCSIVLISSYWGHTYCRMGRLPAIVYSYYFYVSLVLILIGSVMFASQTSDAFSIFYGFTHSAWHVCMALSITFLLPRNKNRFFSLQHNNNNNNSQQSLHSDLSERGSNDSVDSSHENFQCRNYDFDDIRSPNQTNDQSNSTASAVGGAKFYNLRLFNIKLSDGLNSLIGNTKLNKSANTSTPVATTVATVDSMIVDIENNNINRNNEQQQHRRI